MDDLVGRTLGRYQVTVLVGRGGMATVYRGADPVLDRTVAIKVMHSHLAADPTFVSRFRHEAQAVAALRHPNIVKVFDFGNEGESYYMVMEFIDGPTLAALMQAGAAASSTKAPGPSGEPHSGLSTGEILRLFPPLCSAIDYATAHGMVHRDIKPANILLTGEGEPVLADYGIAKIMGATSYTVSGVVMGSAHYMSPEQVQGFPVDHRTDIYSLGVVLFEALAGRVPYDADTTASILAQHLSAPVPPARSINPQLPGEIQAVLERALAKEPERRYQRGGDLAAALQTALAPLPATIYEPIPGPGAALAQTVVEGPGVPYAGSGRPAVPTAATAPPLTEAPPLTQVPLVTPAPQAAPGSPGSPGFSPTRVERVAPEAPAPVTWEQPGFAIPSRGTSRRWWLIAAAAVVVIAIIAVVAVLATRSGEQSTESTVTTTDGTVASDSTTGPEDRSTTTTLAVEVAQLIEDGDALVESGKLDEGIAMYEEALRESPDSDLGRTRLGIAYYLHGGYSTEMTAQQLELATQKNPESAEAWAFLGLAWLSAAYSRKSGDLASAEEACRTAVELDPESGLAHASLGRVLAASDRQEEALTEMQTALDLDPQDPWVQESAGWINAVHGDWETAVPYYETAVTYRPNWASFLSLLGESLWQTGHYDEALEYYETELDLGQGYEASAYQDIGLTLWHKGDSPGAIESLKEALALDENDDYTHWALGAIWDEMEDYEAALPHLQRAAALVPDNAGYQEWLGDCLYYLGRYEEARVAIDKALELEPDREGAQRLSGYLADEGY